LHDLIAKARQALPKASFHAYAPLHRDNEIAGSRAAFGKALDPHYHFDRADAVVALDADFQTSGPDAVRSARAFAARRKIAGPSGALNRLYAIESTYTVTGSTADHRFRVRSHDVARAAFALAAELGVQGMERFKPHGFEAGGKSWPAVIAKDLQDNRGRGLVLAGPAQPPQVHAVVHAINAALGNAGATVTYTETPAALGESQVGAIRALADAIDAGRVDTLVCLDTNPVYEAPADLDFESRLARVAHTVHLGLHVDETAQRCAWHVNMAHPLESWGDLLAYDGTPGFVQPLLAPLFGGLTPAEMLARLIGHEQREGYRIVRDYWAERWGDDFEARFERALRDGAAQGAFAPVPAPAVDLPAVARLAAARAESPAFGRDNLEITFHQDPSLYDGHFANNAWMQELPDPITKLTWDNAALLSRATADAFELRNGDLVRLELDGRALELPAWILPGQADWSIALRFGYGRRLTAEHRIAMGAGFDAYRLRSADAQWQAAAGRLSKLGGRYPLASTQDHGTLEGRPLVREATLERYRADPRFAPEQSPLARAAAVESQREGRTVTERELLKSLWQERDYSKGPQWGMVIDLNSCNGCSACVVACQAENNIPPVGKEQVSLGREMHWLRIDRYFKSEAPSAAEPGMRHQPVPCMQCENAPCESVCPVNATVHSADGLNDMVYNRCIGTRYCSNNCPYKVRRFNWFDFHSEVPATIEMLHNPAVTVRSRGVMEKCTYCVQRISAGRIAARKEDRPVRDGEIVPASGQACPSQAIWFGDITDQGSAVARLRASERNYAMLSELNVKPRTTYLALVRNPNPELA
jgi:molybdopterin-containing oxidoreductase family iron-sulfur binding subunit